MDKKSKNKNNNSIKGTLTRLEAFTSKKTVSKDTSVTEIEIKLKKIEQLQINLDKIAEDYCEIEIFESLEIIQLDIEDINQRIETTEVGLTLLMYSLKNSENVNINLNDNGINGITQSSKYSANIEISNRDYTFARNVQFSLLPKITDAIPVSKLNISDLNIPASIELADSNFHMPGQIDILIGSELFFEILNPEQYYLQEGNVILQNTKFGYLVTGTLPQLQQQANCRLISEPSLDITVKKFFELESLPDDSKEITKSEEEIYCEEHFVSTYKRDKTGRFIVRLPIKENAETLLGYSKENAIKRLNSIWEKLNKNNTMGTLYKELMNEYELLGHMEEIKNETLDKINYYIPHHSVYKPEKTSTPLRVVFDASAKTTSGFSLNSILLNGGIIQQDLFSIVSRFRKHEYAFSADIKKNVHADTC
ncbi:integrase catalytic domain-containing protein [Trichonephila clavipes]|nr:integrase catalytic domain-containing protein [Trichonephila clavipes]